MKHLRLANGHALTTPEASDTPASMLCYIFIDWGSCDSVDQCGFDFGDCGTKDACLIDY
jgi:hypothetical protein